MITSSQVEQVNALRTAGKTVKQACKTVGISFGEYYKWKRSNKPSNILTVGYGEAGTITSEWNGIKFSGPPKLVAEVARYLVN